MKITPIPSTKKGLSIYRFESESGNEYIVSENKGVWICPCGDFVHRGRFEGRDCKHIIRIKESNLRDEEKSA